MRRIPIAALVLLTLVLLLTAAHAGAARQLPAYTSIQGTIQALQPKRGSLDVVTGVGMSLRLVHLTAPPSVRVASGGAGVPLSALKRGDIVRVQCHRSGSQLVADRIQKVRAR